MAKSIYEILDDLKTTTSVPDYGTEIPHTIPRELLPTAEQFEDEQALLDWARETGNLHAVLQKGIQKFLIEIRATFKSCKKKDTWSEEYGQKNVNAMEWTITNRPNQSGNKAALAAKLQAGIEIAQAMKKSGLADKTVLASLIPVYGEDGAQNIMAILAEASEDTQE